MSGIHVNDPAPRNAALELTGQPSLTSGTAFGTAFDEGFYYSPLASLMRHGEQEDERLGEAQAAGGRFAFRKGATTPLLTGKEATEKYGLEGLSWTEPVREGEAQLLNRWKRDELKRANVLGRADPGVLPGAARLA